jgi:hypothetical protein
MSSRLSSRTALTPRRGLRRKGEAGDGGDMALRLALLATIVFLVAVHCG